jgi:hypothetical protein
MEVLRLIPGQHGISGHGIFIDPHQSPGRARPTPFAEMIEDGDDGFCG